MTKEEFEVWWKDNWTCCTAGECTREAYGLVRELLAGARERIATLLEKEGKSGASAFVRMMTVDGFGNPELDLWPHPLRAGDCGMAATIPGAIDGLADAGGVAILVSEGSIKVTAGTGRTLADTTHDYPDLEAWRKDRRDHPQDGPNVVFPKGKCKNGCGAEMGPLGCSAPVGVDPFGDCPAVMNK